MPSKPVTEMKLEKRNIFSWMDARIQLILLLPALVVMFAVFVYPVIYTIYLSFHDWTFFTMQDPPFIGFSHILNVLSDKSFYSSLVRTGIYVGAGVGIQLLLGFTLALAVNQIKTGHGLLTTLLKS